MAAERAKPKAKKTSAKKKTAAKKTAVKAKPIPVKRRVVLKSDDHEGSGATLELEAAAKSAAVIESKSAKKKANEPAALRSASVVQDTLTARSARGVRERDVITFLRQLIMMLNAGTPILKSLNTLSHRGENQGVRAMVSGISEFVGAGNPLWQAFARESRYFSPVDVHLIKAGEASGNLSDILRRVVEYREKRARLIRHMQVAMIYPALLVVAAVAVIFILSRFVIPMFKEFFATLDVPISPFAKIVMNSAEWIGTYWLLPLLIAAGCVAAYRFWVKSPTGRLAADQFKLRIPIAGTVIRNQTMAEFNRTFSLLLRSGISMMATLDLCRNSVRNQAYVSVIQDMRDSVEAGEGLESPLRDAERRKLVPGVVVDMLMTGEETGSVDNVADQIAEIYDEEVENAVNTIKEAVGPIFVLFFGVIVGMLVISMFLPLINMITAISSGSV